MLTRSHCDHIHRHPPGRNDQLFEKKQRKTEQLHRFLKIGALVSRAGIQQRQRKIAQREADRDPVLLDVEPERDLRELARVRSDHGAGRDLAAVYEGLFEITRDQLDTGEDRGGRKPKRAAA